MKIIDNQLLDETSAQAQQSSRRRMNYNFHTSLDEPIHRLLNAMEPDTYIRPHRHLNPSREEVFLLLRGKAVLFLFDDKGEITKQLRLSPEEGVFGAELEAGVWHSLLVLEPNTVVYEVKEGPFAPLSAENMAPWSPDPDNIDAVKSYLIFLSQKALTP